MFYLTINKLILFKLFKTHQKFVKSVKTALSFIKIDNKAAFYPVFEQKSVKI